MVYIQRTEAGLTSKWGRISPAVYWGHQNQYSYIVRRCTTSCGVAKKLADHSLTHPLTHPLTHKVTYGGRHAA